MLLEQKNSDIFKLKIPVDAAKVKDVYAGQNVKVIAQDKGGNISTEVVRLDPSGKSEAILDFPLISGTVRIMVGPENASKEEMLKRTIFVVLLLPSMEFMGEETRMNRQIIKLKVNKSLTMQSINRINQK